MDIGYNDIDINGLIKAIKGDNLKEFRSITQGDRYLNLCYGRFPILAILYLFDSDKILSKYENKLLSVRDYTIVDSDVDVDILFKKKSRRAIRMFSLSSIVEPQYMLAILSDGERLNKRLKYIDDVNIENIKKAYALSNDKPIKEKNGKIIFPNRKKNSGTKVLYSVCAIVCVIVIVLSSLLLFYASKLPNGKDVPYNVSSITALNDAMTANANMKLSSNITVNNKFEEFSGSLDGNGNMLTIENLDGPYLSSLTGSIKNINIVVQNSTIVVDDDFSFFVIKNEGTIDNVSVTIKNSKIEVRGKPLEEGEQAESLYLGFIAALNGGTITNSSVALENVECVGYEHVNSYLGCICSYNVGNVANCEVKEGNLKVDTLDIAGLVAENYGLVSYCNNRLNIEQITTLDSWNPNVSGIVGNNKESGNLFGCFNYGNISATSTSSGEDAPVLDVYVGGIVCQNSGTIEKCYNRGDLKASSKKALNYIGGVAAISNGIIASSISECNIVDETGENNIALVGGIVSYNYSVGVIQYCSSLSTFESICPSEYVICGGVCGLSSYETYPYYMYGFSNYAYCIYNDFFIKDDVHIGIAAYLNVEGKICPMAEEAAATVMCGSKEEIMNLEVYFDETSLK